MYSYTERVRFSETDEELLLQPTGILNYFQDAAIFEAEQSDITMNYLQKRHLAWLLGAWQICIYRRPRLAEEIEITTIPYEFRSFIGNRNFIMKDKDQNVLAVANSIWTLINMETLKPEKPTEEIISAFELGEKMDMPYKHRKIALGEFIKDEASILIGKHHLDSNHHVNNGTYVDLALGYLPEHANVTEIRVEYKNSAYEKDLIIPKLYQNGEAMQIQLQSPEDKVYAIIEFTYKEGQNA